jgi:hypothetical protein
MPINIAARTRQHVLESFFGFTEAIGVSERRLEWQLPIPADAARWRGFALAGRLRSAQSPAHERSANEEDERSKQYDGPKTFRHGRYPFDASRPPLRLRPPGDYRRESEERQSAAMRVESHVEFIPNT